jgi:hypothetical protein
MLLSGENILLVPEGMQRIWIEGQLLGHKADFNKWAHTILQ